MKGRIRGWIVETVGGVLVFVVPLAFYILMP